jgi:hypothetical protein
LSVPQVSALSGILFLELLNLPPGRVNSGARAFAHRAKHREVRGIGQMVFNERHGDIEGKARDRYSRLSVEVQLPHARTHLGVTRRIIDHLGLCRVHRARRCVVFRAAPKIGASRKSLFVPPPIDESPKTRSSLFVFVRAFAFLLIYRDATPDT